MALEPLPLNMGGGTMMENGDKYQVRPMWRRAKFVLPMAGMLIVSGLVVLAMVVIVAKPEVATAVSTMVPAVALAIGGMAAVGGAGVAAHDTFRDRNGAA